LATNKEPTNERLLKCGKTLKTPSLFINARTKADVKLINKTIIRYPWKKANKANDGINQVDGIVISSGDYPAVSPFLVPDIRTQLDPNFYSIDRRIRIIDPAIHFLFSGLEKDKSACCNVVEEWLPQLSSVVDSVAQIDSQKEKLDSSIRKIYPMLDAALIQRLLEFQIRADADILINPSVPLSSPRRINDQTEKTREMNRQGRVLLDTVLPRYKNLRDLMNLTVLDPSVLTSANMDSILDATLQGNPDMIGVRLMSFDEKNSVEAMNFLKFLKTLSSSGKPIVVFNVREFGYVAFCYGASAISMPIAKSPYMRKKKASERAPPQGSYYHYYDMIDYAYKDFPDIIRAKNYKLPCHCEICAEFDSFLNIERKKWNYVRKVHFLLVKNMEMQEFRSTNVPLNTALKDKFGRSRKTAYVEFLPESSMT
jgi:hypothetical protein